MQYQIRPDRDVPGAFELWIDTTPQSWVDPSDPTLLVFEYVQRIAEALDATVLTRPVEERIRVVHLGGGALSLPRYVEHCRPRTAQIVCEPNGEMTEEVRRVLPLARNSGIKVRETDGRSGIGQMVDAYADAVVIDAFDGDQIPGDLATVEFFADVNRVLRPGGMLAMNLSGRAPFSWAKRCLAAMRNSFSQLAVSSDPATWKGRRFGNLVAIASNKRLPVRELDAAARRSAQPYKLIHGSELRNWIGESVPFTDADAEAAPGGKGWL